MYKLKECPHCHSKEGYYIKYQYKGTGIVRFSFDNKKVIENEDMYDCLLATPSKYTYCLECNKRLEKVED